MNSNCVRCKRKKPPGQRLIRYAAISAAFVLVQSTCLPLGNQCATSLGQSSQQVVTIPPPFSVTSQFAELREKMKTASDLNKKLKVGVFAVNPVTGEYVDLDSQRAYPAASIIKIPILVSLMIAVDKKEVSPTQLLSVRADLVTGGSGNLQWSPVGTKFSVKDVARLMIVISDNTATNMLIDLLGGKDKLNQQFASWGLKQTRINNLLADLKGTNKTNPYELVYLLGRIDQGELLSATQRKWMYQILEKTKTRTLLPQGLPPGTKICHKTGDIASMVGDAGIITASDGTKYFVAVQVERPSNDRRANELIRNLSKMIYQQFTQPKASANTAGKPSSVSGPVGAPSNDSNPITPGASNGSEVPSTPVGPLPSTPAGPPPAISN